MKLVILVPVSFVLEAEAVSGASFLRGLSCSLRSMSMLQVQAHYRFRVDPQKTTTPTEDT